MFIYLEQLLISLGNHVPLEFFAFTASFFEEVIPPIPSPAIAMAIGSFSEIQKYSILGMIVLILLATLGKTIGSIIVYVVSYKVENIFSSKIAKFLGITAQDIESFGARLGKGWRDYVILTILRGLPIVPSVLISVGGGLLKINFKLYVITTFVGSLIRSLIYFYLGYAGMNVFSSLVKNTAKMESLVQIVAIVAIIIFLGYLYYKRSKKKV